MIGALEPPGGADNLKAFIPYLGIEGFLIFGNTPRQGQGADRTTTWLSGSRAENRTGLRIQGTGRGHPGGSALK